MICKILYNENLKRAETQAHRTGAGTGAGSGLMENKRIERRTAMGFKEIGRKIQMAREEKGMTQVDLAQAMGITQAALSNYELGKRRLYLHQIEGIARILGRKLDFFISEGTETVSPKTKDPGGISALKISERINGLDDSELRRVSEFLDYLEWRRRHVHSD
jgi:transcriptional regulator with XRE-family HTH domain